jgi:predicted RNase H-like HicB family nuclease
MLVASVPDLRGAHTQAASLDELVGNLREVIELIQAGDQPRPDTEFVGLHMITV